MTPASAAEAACRTPLAVGGMSQKTPVPSVYTVLYLLSVVYRSDDETEFVWLGVDAVFLTRPCAP